MDPAQKFVKHLKAKISAEKCSEYLKQLVSIQPMTKPLEKNYYHLEYISGSDNDDSNNK